MIKKTRKLHKLLKWNRYEMPHVARLSSLCCKRCLLFLGRSQHLFQLLWTASRLYWYLLHFPMPANTLPHSPPPHYLPTSLPHHNLYCSSLRAVDHFWFITPPVFRYFCIDWTNAEMRIGFGQATPLNGRVSPPNLPPSSPIPHLQIKR